MIHHSFRMMLFTHLTISMQSFKILAKEKDEMLSKLIDSEILELTQILCSGKVAACMSCQERFCEMQENIKWTRVYL